MTQAPREAASNSSNSVATGCAVIMTVITAEDGVPGPIHRSSREIMLAKVVSKRTEPAARVALRRAVVVVDAVVHHDVTSAAISAGGEVVARHDVLAARMAR